jgi:hypothetical protein
MLSKNDLISWAIMLGLSYFLFHLKLNHDKGTQFSKSPALI